MQASGVLAGPIGKKELDCLFEKCAESIDWSQVEKVVKAFLRDKN